ncbi:hypothetical protein D9619_011340 [Psilocybe cf. subviscida]|uniref:Mob1/phocein n=1 Tax=Psilocybe cf. subviscida TaxID=2480587 RepID=A0A8H5F5D8_9AGAR|nr:hypothetical protein D9619_011340 [Psilocybe cf. subviscida]
MAAVIQRPLRGSRISTFYPVKNLPSLSSLDSAFQLQEYISLLIRLDVHDVDSIVSLPGTSKKDATDGDAEKSVDEACWIYEQLRRLAQDLSHPLITTLQQECNRASCPEMKAGEWLYLCVAHGNDGAMEQCCAIDYILHTVDSATALLNSPRTFPSRLQIPQTSHRHFSSLARRLGRIFAHAYFHHREAFEQAEAESSLYARFLALTSKFDLVPPEFLVIPPAQFTGDEHGQVHERDLPRGYPDRQQQHNPPQLREEDHNSLLAPPAANNSTNVKQLAQQQLGMGRRSPPTASPVSASQSINTATSGSPNGGIGETPSPASKLRLGRSRTDTMIFSEPEANAFADELAARSRSSGADEEHEPKSVEEADIEPIDESEVPFEISLEEEAQVLEDLTAPTDIGKEEEGPALAAATGSQPTDNNAEQNEASAEVENAPEHSAEEKPEAAPTQPVEAISEAQEQPAADAEAQEAKTQTEGGPPELTYAEAAVVASKTDASASAAEPTEEDVTDASNQETDVRPLNVSPPAAEPVHLPEQAEEFKAAEPPAEEETAAAPSAVPPPASVSEDSTPAVTTATASSQEAEVEPEPASDTSILEESEVAALVESDGAEAVLESQEQTADPAAEHGHQDAPAEDSGTTSPPEAEIKVPTTA